MLSAPVPGRRAAPDVRVPRGLWPRSSRRCSGVRVAAAESVHFGRRRSGENAYRNTIGSTNGRRSYVAVTARPVPIRGSLIPHRLSLSFPRCVLRLAGRGDHLSFVHRRCLAKRVDRSRIKLALAWFTLWQSVVATGLALVVELPAAYVGRSVPVGGAVCAFVTVVRFVLPTVVVATAFLVLFRPGGALVPRLAARGRAAARRGGVLQRRRDRAHGRRLLVAARSASHRRPCARRVSLAAFREVTLPLLGPPIAAAASIVFLFTFTAFGVVLLIADPAHATLEVEIYRQAVQLFDLPTAAALALVQMVGVVSLLLVLARMQERRSLRSAWWPRGRGAPAGGRSGRLSASWSSEPVWCSAARCSCSRSSRCG